MHRALFIMKCENEPGWMTASYSRDRARRLTWLLTSKKNCKAKVSESFVQIRELLSRDCPVAYNYNRSLVAEDESPVTQENVAGRSRRTCWNWSGERTFYFLTGFLYKTFQFLFRLPKCNEWLFIHSFARVKQNVAERGRRAVQEDLPEWCVGGNCVQMENPQEQRCCTLRKCITLY